jgi:hypothetical protein
MSSGYLQRSCPSCGAELVKGDLAFPILGTARFSYKVKTFTVETEIFAYMCSRCAAIWLYAKDPTKILRAYKAASGMK